LFLYVRARADLLVCVCNGHWDLERHDQQWHNRRGWWTNWHDNMQLFYNRAIVVFSREVSPQIYRPGEKLCLKSQKLLFPTTMSQVTHVSHPSHSL
jgi:hypothetical protein